MVVRVGLLAGLLVALVVLVFEFLVDSFLLVLCFALPALLDDLLGFLLVRVDLLVGDFFGVRLVGDSCP